jgi:hypothetical protein
MGLLDHLRRSVCARGIEGKPDPIVELHIGRVDAALHAAGAVLGAAARQIDEGLAESEAGSLLALRVRAIVAAAVETTIREVGHALGPAPLAFDEAYARRIADLELYVRQHHGEHDLATLGNAIVLGKAE